MYNASRLKCNGCATRHMDFTASKAELKYLADVLAHMGEASASPSTNTITMWDFTKHQRLEYSPAGGRKVEDGADVGIDAASVSKIIRRVRGDARVTVSTEEIVVAFENTTYRLRPLVHEQGPDRPETAGSGTVTMPVRSLNQALADVAASGAAAVVIAAKDGVAELRGEGSNDCWVDVPDSEAAGMGYSRLGLDMLVKCVPDIPGMDATISLSPKGPTKMMFGRHITYHQAGRA